MANDRVIIKCAGCSGWKMLLKYFPTDGLTTRDNGILEWLDQHAHCHPRDGEPDLSGDPGFSLHTEVGFGDGTLDWDRQGKIGLDG